MQPTLHCFGVGVVLFLLAPLTGSFSRGANQASCQEMTPGHIRAQPRYLQHSHVTLHTSASSYLPGQLLTVTVRSSRDFMGFLLQARSVESARVRARTGAGPRVKSTRVGPVLVGGSWTFTPPGTHTLHCFSEGDTITHSDKQLKRNLSFVWRAPDAPMGDIRFYITVVQSYFVYWAGIESAVVHDGSQSNTPSFALQGEEVTDLPALRSQKASNKQTSTPVTTLGPATKTRRGTQVYKFLETGITHPVLTKNSSATLASIGVEHLTNQGVKLISSKTSGSHQNATKGRETDTNVTSGYLSGVTEETGLDMGNHFTLAKESESSLFLPKHLPFSTSFSLAEDTGTETDTTSPNITEQNSTSPFSMLQSLASFVPLTDGKINKKEPKTNIQDSELTSSPETTDTALNHLTTTTAPSVSHSFHNTNPTISMSYSIEGTIQDKSSSVMQSGSSQLWRNNLTKSQTLSPNITFSSKSPTLKSFLQRHVTPAFTQPHPLWLLPTKHLPTRQQAVTDSLKPQPENSHLGTKTGPKQTSSLLDLDLQTATPQPKTSPNQSQGQTSSPQTNLSQTKVVSISSQPWSQVHSQTTAQVHTIGWKQSQPSVTPGPSRPPLVTSRFNPGVTLDKHKEVKDFQSKTRTEPIMTFVPSTTPYFSASTDESTLHSPSSTSTHSLLTSSLVQHNSTTPLHSYKDSTQVSIRPSIMSSLFTHLSSSSMKTAPAISVLSAPSSISTPPSSSASSTTPSSNYFTRPSPDPLFSPVTLSPSSPFMSSASITGSTFSSSSSSTIPPVLSSSSNVSPVSSISSSSISTSTPSSFSPGLSRSTNSSIPSSSFMSFDSTTPYPGPSPAPRRSLYNPLMSSSSPVSSQRLTVGQRLLMQNHMTSSNPVPNLNPQSPRTAVHTNPEPHPNFKLNIGHEWKPNLPNTKNKPKRPSNLPGTPDKEEKYPDIIPRHSAWELGMLLGSSAGLGMVLVVGVRYMYRQVCRKQTEMTLNDREREYGRGERGLIHVQECGDLVRVRRIRENSFVLLAEYDILATPGD